MKKIEEIDKALYYFSTFKNALDDLQTRSPEVQKILEEKYKSFLSINSSNASTEKKGKALEELVVFMINSTQLFDIKTNVRTSTNEIDDVIIIKDGVEPLIKNGTLDEMYAIFLGECKDYKKTIPVTYVGKFYSLMYTSSIKLGIMFSAKRYFR